MQKIINNKPNDTVAILCEIRIIDKEHHNYAIVPIEVTFGSLNDDNSFTPETSDETIECVTSFDELDLNVENRKFYYNPITIKDLKKKYKDISNSTVLAFNYFRDIAVNDKIFLMYKTDKISQPVVETVTKRNPENIKRINEELETKYFDTFVAKPKVQKSEYTVADELLSIKRAELSKYLRERIINNDSILDDVATTVVGNFRCKNPKLIRNILCVGPTGCGKTATFRLIANYTDIPFTEFDCNELTAAGYVGSSVDDIMKKVYYSCSGKMEKAERAILLLDEFDKLAIRGAEVKDEFSQDALLKVVEGYKFEFDSKALGGRKTIDTSFMTKVGAGAFMELFDKNKQKHSLGFNQVDEVLSEKELKKEDIIKYGFKPELVGRFKLIRTYKPLDRDGLLSVLKSAKDNALELQRIRFKEEFDCDLVPQMEYLEAIVDEALKTQEGGRSLDNVVDDSLIKLQAAMYDEMDEGHRLPKTYQLRKELVNNPSSFTL